MSVHIRLIDEPSSHTQIRISIYGHQGEYEVEYQGNTVTGNDTLEFLGRNGTYNWPTLNEVADDLLEVVGNGVLQIAYIDQEDIGKASDSVSVYDVMEAYADIRNARS